MKQRSCWLMVGAMLLLGAAGLSAHAPPIAHILIPAGGWCVLKGVS